MILGKKGTKVTYGEFTYIHTINQGNTLRWFVINLHSQRWTGWLGRVCTFFNIRNFNIFEIQMNSFVLFISRRVHLYSLRMRRKVVKFLF